MKIGFVVNDVSTEKDTYTTIRLALAASQRDHEVWLMGLGDFGYEPGGSLHARARRADPARSYRSLTRYLEDVQASETTVVTLSEFDVVLMRADPADSAEYPWANTAGVAFGHMMATSGVLVVNDPVRLASAISKAYFQHFPEVVRPRTLISRDESRIREFVEESGGRAVLKPLQGSGGSGVFMVNTDEAPNLSQIVEAIARDGYVVAQEYLEDAKDGDIRMFVMNGRPLQVDGAYAAFRRKSSSSDPRSNMSAGGTAHKVQISPAILEMVETVRPKLQEDGMFLVGLDIVGDKLMEVNVFSPGGFGSCENLYGVNFTPAVIEDLERKVAVRQHYGPELTNARLAAH
nr:glutathione synthase [Actinomycetales bacterium]